MDKVIAKKDFVLNGINYLKGETVEIKIYDEVIKLNALGFIEPLSHSDLVLIKRELENLLPPKSVLFWIISYRSGKISVSQEQEALVNSPSNPIKGYGLGWI